MMVLQLWPDNFYGNLFWLSVALLDESVSGFVMVVSALMIILGLLVLQVGKMSTRSSRQTIEQAIEKASKPASKQASKHASKQASKQAN